MLKNTVCSWSGGKDSCFALLQAITTGYTPKVLLNVLNEEGRISRSHGIPAEILQVQSVLAGLPIHLISSSWQAYEEKFTEALVFLKSAYDLQYAVFGDIDLQAHRDWEEKVCAASRLTALLPLWKQDRKALVLQMIEAGIETIIVSCNETMGPNFIGQTITPALIAQLEALGVDTCGENGEFHTLVVDCPLFSSHLEVRLVDTINHNGYWFGKTQLAMPIQ